MSTDKAQSQGESSFQDFMQAVGRAFRQTFESPDSWVYVEEHYNDHLIADADGKFYRVTYTRDGNTFTFAPRESWVQVGPAWEPIRPLTQPIKSTEHFAVKTLGGNRLGGYAAIWGDESTPDLDGEWFDPQTEEMTDIFKSVGRLPYLYDHAMDGTVKTAIVGLVDVLAEDEIGLWYEAQLDKANQYATAIQQLASAQKLGTSSGTLIGARRVEKSGRIARWPIVELSGTTMPADPRQRTEHPVSQIKSIFQSAGLDLDIAGLSHTAKTAEPEAGGNPAATVAEEERKRQLILKLSILELSQ